MVGLHGVSIATVLHDCSPSCMVTHAQTQASVVTVTHDVLAATDCTAFPGVCGFRHGHM